MIAEIKNELLKLEQQHNIKILYAVESGSRAWGFESVNSDWDVRFIYIHNQDWYLSIEHHKDSIDVILPNDIDLAGWELQKALLLFRKSNPSLFEWINSPIVYQMKFNTIEWLRDAAEIYFNPRSCLYHYLNMAENNFDIYFKEETVKLKKYFYILRPLLACMWIEKYNSMPPIEFTRLMEDADLDKKLVSEILQLMERKRKAVELEQGQRISVIDVFIEEKLAHYNNYVKLVNDNKEIGFEKLNSIFRDSLSQAWN